MRVWFERFNLREQLALLTMGGAIALYALFLWVLLPLAEARETLAGRNKATAAVLSNVDAMAAEIRALREGDGAARVASPGNLTALLNQSANRYQLRISRVQPNNRGAVQLRFETASLEPLLRWLHELESVQGLLVEELSMSQSGTPGIVSATLRVATLN